MTLLKTIRFWKTTDRIGPEIPWTHWRLYHKPWMVKFCKRKFKHFGENAEFRPGAYAIACSKISLGKRVVIRPGTMLSADPRPKEAGITIEDDVMLGPGVHIYVNNHTYTDRKKSIHDQGYEPSKDVVLKKGCWVGANVILLPGVTIGKNSVVGAGSVVTKSIPAYSVAVGSPAKVIKKIK